MAGPVLYSTNPWIAHQLTKEYLNGIHYVWCSEYFDPAMAPPGSVCSAIAPSSSPKGIFEALKRDCDNEDTHSALIKNYRKTFKRLAKNWLADSTIGKSDHEEILARLKSNSWKIWRPVLYVIPRENIDKGNRLIKVPLKYRASIGPELQIHDLALHEFDIIHGAFI